MKKLPNIVFIIADQMKANALRMYSDIGIETPNLEILIPRRDWLESRPYRAGTQRAMGD